MSFLLRLVLLMDLLGANGLSPPPPGPAHELSVGGSAQGMTGSGSGGTPGFVRVGAVIGRSTNGSNSQESLEWVVANSHAIVRVRLESEAAEEESFLVLERLKGSFKEGELIKIKKIAGALPGREMLLFLQTNNDNSKRYSSNTSWSAIGLNGKIEVVLMDLRRVSESEEILKATRIAAAYPSTQPLKKLQLNVENGTLGQYGTGFNFQLVVPIDDRLQKLAQDWMSQNSVQVRRVGLQAIRPFKSPQNIERVQRLLSDTRSRNPRGTGKWQMGFYHVRADAAEVLRAWDVSVPTLAESGPILQYRAVSVSNWHIIFICAACFAWLLISYFASRWTFSRGTAVGFLRLNTIAISLALAVLAGWMWWRSQGHVDELTFSLDQSHHEVASYAGGIQYVVVREWTLPPAILAGHFDRSLHDDQWAINGMNRSSTTGSMGFVTAKGLLNGPANVIHPFTLFRLPYWALLAPLMLIITMVVFKIGRSINRARRGLCRHCGYDLRENRVGQCPECGAASGVSVAAVPAALAQV